ncbi:MAG: chemotaxis protein methyltransferase CheR [Actinomycetota bacterium]|nr:chemotaxis protein methyltransferase CheR [Actinomycetota bacterium]
MESLGVDLLLEGVHRHYGYDFRSYARGSLTRRIRHRASQEGVGTATGLLDLVLHSPSAMQRLLYDLSINVTSMFRDPDFYRAFRERVVPMLKTYPFVRIWNAGCSTGEETYSLAILLAEVDLLEKSRIYATDMNDAVLERAASGVFPLEKMRDYTSNYIAAGGSRAFSEYYSTGSGGARFHGGLSDNVVFAQHNLVSDRSFNEFHAIVCRNVLIYFDTTLQAHVHELFHSSLVPFGVLALGSKESIRGSGHAEQYEELDGPTRLYRRIA